MNTNTVIPVEQDNDEMVIDIGEVLRMLWSKLPWILLVAVIAAVITAVITKTMIRPTYEASVQMYVLSNPDQQVTTSANTGELNAAKSLADIYSVILKSNTVIDKVATQVIMDNRFPEREINREVISGMSSVSTVNSTSVMKVSVKDRDPAFAADVANAFATEAPAEITRVTKAGGVEIVDYADIPEKPVSPSMSRNAIIAFLLGFILMCGIFFLRMQMDHTVVTEDDLKSVTEIPVLATIPDIQVNAHTKAAGWDMMREEA